MKVSSIPEHGTDSHDDSESDLVTDSVSGADSFDDNDQEDVGIKSFSLLDEVEQLKLQVRQLQADLEEFKIIVTNLCFIWTT